MNTHAVQKNKGESQDDTMRHNMCARVRVCVCLSFFFILFFSFSFFPWKHLHTACPEQLKVVETSKTVLSFRNEIGT